MIVTLTPNPSIDRTICVARLDRGALHRATDSRVEPGGKGVNVTRALTANGTASLAVLPVGGGVGVLLRQLLDRCGAPYVAVPVAGTTRTNTTVAEPDGTTTKFNEPGASLSATEAAALLQAVADQLGAGLAWVVGSGSLPPGMAADGYADLVRLGQGAGARVAVDSSGSALRAAVAACPDLLTPNLEEMEQLTGIPLRTLSDVREAAGALVRSGVGTVLVSLGEHGALLVAPGVVVHAVAFLERPVSSVAAGDCLLAGYLDALGRNADPPSALAAAVAWGTAAAALPGSSVPAPADIARIEVSVVAVPDDHLPVARLPRSALAEEQSCR